MTLPDYILITPARNEAQYIANTIQCVIRQTHRPLKWVIVNDGSTDDTGALAECAAKGVDWIEVLHRPVRAERDFAAKVHAFNLGIDRVASLPYRVIGCLDADVTLDDDHFEFLMARFGENSRLGCAGTIFKEEGYSSDTDSFEGHNHVSGQCQLFRRECFEEIGGYVANEGGGIDWIAVTTARMIGWRTQSFREKSFFHHRRLGTAGRSAFAAAFAYGYKDYYMGTHPVWEMFRVFYRMTKKPYLFAGLGLGFGFGWAVLTRPPHPISKQLMEFYRGEQLQKLHSVFGSLLRFKRVDKFNVNPGGEAVRR